MKNLYLETPNVTNLIILISTVAFLLVSSRALATDYTDPVTGMKFIKVESATFQIGDASGQGRANERPVLPVTVQTFFIGKHEVSVGQFSRFVEATNYRTDAEKIGWVLDIDAAMGSFTRKEGISWKNPGFTQTNEHPVVWVNWNDATAYAKWLSTLSGSRYSLPTEAQWEFAAKGPEGSRWSGANESGLVDQIAWFSENSDQQTHPVSTKAPNSFGVYDMSGNVWEWCSSVYMPYGQTVSGAPYKGKSELRTIRGGSWRVGNGLVTTTYRNGYKTSYAHSSIGFRLVMNRSQ